MVDRTRAGDFVARLIRVFLCMIALTTGAGAHAGLVPRSLDVGVQSMGTISPLWGVRFRNEEAGAVAITSVAISNSQFEQTGPCISVSAPPDSVPPGAECFIGLVFKPTASVGPFGTTVPVTATLIVTSSGTSGPDTITISGIAERSLVSHYYYSILRRTPDAGGTAYWSGEAQRMLSLGANLSEAWYAMAMSFFNSAEFVATHGGSDQVFLNALYYTFFIRVPDAAGQAYWLGQLNSGLPREVLLASFLFSTEFGTTVARVFGETNARPESDAVLDFYRGLLGRLPDSDGYNHWLQRFRDAQCNGAEAVYAEVEAISSLFANGAEFLARGRSNAAYVGDLFNAFLRRGGDLGGVQFWINALNTGARSREKLRQDFLASPEFSARVSAIIARGCAGRHLFNSAGSPTVISVSLAGSHS